MARIGQEEVPFSPGECQGMGLQGGREEHANFLGSLGESSNIERVLDISRRSEKNAGENKAQEVGIGYRKTPSLPCRLRCSKLVKTRQGLCAEKPKNETKTGEMLRARRGGAFASKRDNKRSDISE